MHGVSWFTPCSPGTWITWCHHVPGEHDIVWSMIPWNMVFTRDTMHLRRFLVRPQYNADHYIFYAAASWITTPMCGIYFVTYENKYWLIASINVSFGLGQYCITSRHYFFQCCRQYLYNVDPQHGGGNTERRYYVVNDVIMVAAQTVSIVCWYWNYFVKVTHLLSLQTDDRFVFVTSRAWIIGRFRRGYNAIK